MLLLVRENNVNVDSEDFGLLRNIANFETGTEVSLVSEFANQIRLVEAGN